jgi:hypothetical protein
LLVSLALAETLIHIGAGKRTIVLAQTQTRDAMQRVDIGDLIAQRAFDGLNENRLGHPARQGE